MAVEGIIGIKLGMTQIFATDGNLVGCTVLQAGPCVVVQRRTKEKDGYDAAQLGLVEFVKPQRVNKAMTGHFKNCLLYTSPSPRDGLLSRMPSSA